MSLLRMQVPVVPGALVLSSGIHGILGRTVVVLVILGVVVCTVVVCFVDPVVGFMTVDVEGVVEV